MFVLMLKKALPVSSNNGNETTSSSHMTCASPQECYSSKGEKRMPVREKGFLKS